MVQQQPPRARWPQPRALLALLLGCGCAGGPAPPAAAQSARELRTYQQRMEQLFERLDQNSDRRLERLEVEGVPYLERHFERLDQRQRGYLTPDDLRPAGRADRNGDGLIERAEAATFPRLLQRFDEADSNGDGVLSREELRRWRGRRSER